MQGTLSKEMSSKDRVHNDFNENKQKHNKTHKTTKPVLSSFGLAPCSVWVLV